MAEEQLILRDIVRKTRYAIRPELQTDAVCIAASPQLLDLIAVESAADDEMVVDAVCLLSVFRAADILELLAKLCISPLQTADVILQIALSTLFRLRFFSRPVGEMQSDVVFREVRMYQARESLLCVLLVKSSLNLARRLAAAASAAWFLKHRIYVRVHVIAADIYAFADEGAPLIHGPVSSFREWLLS